LTAQSGHLGTTIIKTLDNCSRLPLPLLFLMQRSKLINPSLKLLSSEKQVLSNVDGDPSRLQCLQGEKNVERTLDCLNEEKRKSEVDIKIHFGIICA